MKQRPPWSWSGFVAAVIALALGGAFAVAMIGATLQSEPITTYGASLLNTIGGGLVAVLSLWIGSQVEGAAQQKGREEHEMSDTIPTQNPDPQQPDPATNPDRDIEEEPQDPDAQPRGNPQR